MSEGISGVLFRIKLGADAAEIEDLDVAGGKTLINGSLLLMSSDNFNTCMAGVVARREAARALGDGPVFVSFSTQSEEEARDTKVRARARPDAAPRTQLRAEQCLAHASTAHTTLRELHRLTSHALCSFSSAHVFQTFFKVS